MRPTALLLASTLVAFTGCSDDTSSADDGGADDGGQTFDAVQDPDAVVYDAGPPLDAYPAGGVDVLFVIDNSGSMAEEQANLAASIGSFVTTLQAANGNTLPSIQIGVVSTDVGAGPFVVGGCSGNGDNGALQSAAQGQCSPPDGAFISDLIGPDSNRQRNYTGALDDVFECISVLGLDGCGFEQPLESMRRALNGSIGGNAGFLRSDALLAVVIVTDEDDCSTADTDMFDTSQTDISDPLGPLSSFRCFEFGVVCDPDEPRTPGAQASCTSREDSQYMYPVQEYIDFLQQLKPGNVVVSTIQGNPTPVVIGVNDMGNPELEPSCVSASGEASPGVRLDQFIGGFPSANNINTICNQMSSSLQNIAQLIASHL
jgi:hypothetical protein